MSEVQESNYWRMNIAPTVFILKFYPKTLNTYKHMERMGKWYNYTPINTEGRLPGNTADVKFESNTQATITGNEVEGGSK